MVRYARSLAQENGIACPVEVTTDFAACRTFLDHHALKFRAKGGARGMKTSWVSIEGEPKHCNGKTVVGDLSRRTSL
jgi:hypothetical protein